MRLIGTLLSILCLISSAAFAEDAALTYELEWSKLERSIESYTKVRDQELMAIERLREVAATLQDSAYDANVPVDELRKIDRGLGEAWDEAYALSRRTSELRSDLYDQMDLLAQIARELELAAPSSEIRSTPDGYWRFEATPGGVTGMMELELVGNQINGQYSSSNGNLVLLRGTYFNGRLRLQRLGSALEIIGEVIGGLDPETGELSGTWSSRELGSGEYVRGEWTAWPAEPQPSETPTRGPGG